MNGVGGRGPGERVLHGTGGVGGASRKSVVRRSTLKEAGAGVRREAHVGRATLTMEARLAGKQEKERAQAYMKAQRMRDPSYWCAPGVDDEVIDGLAASGSCGGEEDGNGDDEVEGAVGDGEEGETETNNDDKDYNTFIEPIRLTAEQTAAELTRLLSGAAARSSLLVPTIRGSREGEGDGGDAATRSGRAHY